MLALGASESADATSWPGPKTRDISWCMPFILMDLGREASRNIVHEVHLPYKPVVYYYVVDGVVPRVVLIKSVLRNSEIIPWCR